MSHQDKAVQIVSVGTETDRNAFVFHQKILDSILTKIDSDTKVCVISVVGAFRTGKSFLLSWFLRYLEHRERSPDASTQAWFDETTSLDRNGFHWRGGSKPDTTGVWMWTKPFYLSRSSANGNNERIAVLLMDTQGMFDNGTTMDVTKSIFGITTLMSSYQVYNVSQRIGEDSLQHLSFFSEYGKAAAKAFSVGHRKPFQNLEFLVRDWPNFENQEDIVSCEEEMRKYLKTQVLVESTGDNDLRETRNQIYSCFEDISCFLMPHPGLKVTRPDYNGKIRIADPSFKRFINRYCERVFGNLVAKSINGCELNAVDLGEHIKAYARVFEANDFPEPTTLLKAVASANNINASHKSINHYKDSMDKKVGLEYVKPQLLEKLDRDLRSESLNLFDEKACFGDEKDIEEARRKVEDKLNIRYQEHINLNGDKGRKLLEKRAGDARLVAVGAVGAIMYHAFLK